jgi:hypothetical protein
MNHKKRAILYGLAIWAFTLFVALLIFPLRDSERRLFESIMPVALASATVAAALRYFRTGVPGGALAGFRVGLIWLALSLAIDLVVFSRGPMAMSLADYVKDVGVTYLMIPVIASGFGHSFAAAHGRAA